MDLPFGWFLLMVIVGIILVGLLIGRLIRPREDPYALRAATGPSSLGVSVDPDEQAAAVATAIRIKAQRDRKFAAALRQDKRTALLAAGVPEAQIDPVLKKLAGMDNALDQAVEERMGTFTKDWSK